MNRVNRPTPTRVYAATGIDQINVSRDQGGCGKLHKKGRNDERLVIDCPKCAAALDPGPIAPSLFFKAGQIDLDQLPMVNFAPDPKDRRLLNNDERQALREADAPIRAAASALAQELTQRMAGLTAPVAAPPTVSSAPAAKPSLKQTLRGITGR